MPEPTARELIQSYIAKKGAWIIYRPDGTVGIPIQVVDVKVAYGDIRLLCNIMGTNQSTWLSTSSVRLNEKENEDA